MKGLAFLYEFLNDISYLSEECIKSLNEIKKLR